MRLNVVGLPLYTALCRCAALSLLATVAYATTHADVRRLYGRVPIVFEENIGQGPMDAEFVAHGPGYTTLLNARHASFRVNLGHTAHADFQLEWVGHSVRRHPVGRNLAITTSNYFIGNDPALWKTRIKNYESVEYSSVYPGIDLVFHGNQRHLEYDWKVAPGADPRRIAVRFQNIRRAALDAGGSLLLDVGGGTIRQPVPLAWQENGDGSRRYIKITFMLGRRNTVRFRFEPYDRTRELIIDPMLVYSTFLGGAGDNQAFAVAVDSTGSAYIAGYTEPFSPGVYHAFISKLNPAGDAVVYSTIFGGDGDAVPSGIAVDPLGAAYVTGKTYSSNFPTTAGALQTSFGNPADHFSADAFVTKFSADGASMAYSTFLGGSANDVGAGIAVDGAGAAYVTGSTGSPNFAVTPGSLQTSFAGFEDGFVSKLNANGTALVYSTYLGGTCRDQGYAIAIDGSGNAYVTGNAQSAEFPVTPGAYQTNIKDPCVNEHGDAFVSKINAAGTGLVYSTFLGGNTEDQGNGIAVDQSGNAYVVGTTSSIDFPTTPGSYRTASAGGIIDAFVTKINPTGTGLLFSTYLGGSFYDFGNGIAVDAQGNVYIIGSTESRDFPVTPGAVQPLPGWSATTSSEQSNAFVSKLNPAGSALLYSTYLGGSANDRGNAIALDSMKAIYVAGGTSSSNFPLTTGAIQPNLSGGTDAFVSKLDTGTSCVASLPNSNLAVDPNGATVNITVTIPSNCNWFSESRENWVKVISGNPARGSGAVGLQVEGNHGPARSGAVQIAGQVVTISQIANCTYSPTPVPPFPAKGGDGEFWVDSAFGCSWTATTAADWIRLIDPTTHFTGAFQDFVVSPNLSSVPRQADIHVADQKITVKQDAGPPPFLSITKTHIGNFRPGQSNAKFTITVSNAPGSPATSGPIQLNEQPGLYLIFASMSGQGWDCGPFICFRSDPLPGGSSYPPITVTLSVAANAPSHITNSASVLGGGSPTATVSDEVTITSAAASPYVRDFRGIGRSDAVIYNLTNGQEYTALSSGDGAYQYIPNLLSAGFDTLRTGDLNSDSKADMVVYNSQSALAYIGTGNGDGTFSFQSLFWSPGYNFVEAGDLNGDGKTDFALYNSSTGTMYTGISNGAGAFTYKYTLISIGYTYIRLADFTGDGKADLFAYSAATGATSVGVGDGAGGFTFHSFQISPNYNLIETGDLNADGEADLLLYNATSGNAATGISDGAGGFAFTSMPFSPAFTAVRLADFTGDGKADVVVYNKNTALAYFGTGTGTGTFAFQSLFWSPKYNWVEPEDVNGDGKVDVVLYNSLDGTEYTGISNGNGTFSYTYQYWGIGRTLAR